MKTAIALTLLAALGIAVVAGVTVAVVCRCLARDEAADEHDCGGTCPAHDVGPDDLEAVARVTGLVVFNVPTLADITDADVIHALTAHATCPDYVDEIKWGRS